MFRTIHAAAADIRQGILTPLQLLEECLERIDRFEPSVHAWVFVDRAGARAQAERLTAELRRGHDRGPLHGIPLGIKDIIDVADWPTAAGFVPWAHSMARQDATIVKRLRQAGAVLLGKTVTTQFASFDPPPTRNPWDLSRTPGGSSSGSAAAVACGMCLGALGSQTGGSITRPASFCGVAGCKPTFGRVCLDGIVPLAPSMDHPGPIASCVRDLAILYDVIADPRLLQPASVEDSNQHFVGHAPRIGRPRGLFYERADPVMRALMDRVCQRVREVGAPVSEVALPAEFAEVLPRHRTVMAVEAAAFHQARLERQAGDFLPRIRSLVEEGLACPAPEYVRTMQHKQQLRAAMHECFTGIDVLVTPATLGPAPDASTTGDPAFNSPWSYTGSPTVSVLAGWSDDGMPLAIQLVAKCHEEADLLAAAAWCEHALAVPRREPTVLA